MPSQETSIFLSVVMPVYNEEHCVRESIRRIRAFMDLKNWAWELLIVSDGSKDDTDRLVMEAAASDSHIKLLRSEQNRGKGATVRRGVLNSSGRTILVTDADLAAPIKEVDKLLKTLDEGFDIAIGSRAIRKAGRKSLLAARRSGPWSAPSSPGRNFSIAARRSGPWSAPSSPGCDVQQSWQRALSSRVFNGFVQALILQGFKDTQCGFKCFKREAALPVFEAQKLDGFCFDVEILYLAVQRGFKIKEVPVMWKAGEKSKVRLLKDSIRMVGELFTLRKLYKSGALDKNAPSR